MKEHNFNCIDIHAFKFNLMFKKNSKFYSILGEICGFISIIFIIIVLIFNLSTLFGRKKFDIISSLQRNYNSKIEFNNISIMFGFADFNNKFINTSKLFNINLIYINGEDIISFPFINCENFRDYFNESLNDSFCVNLNNISLNKKDLLIESSQELFISIQKCINDCYDNNTIEELLERGIFYLVFPEYEIDHFNYLHPINKKYNYELFQFHPKFYKTYQFSFSKLDYFSYNGYLFSNFMKYNIFFLENIFLDFSDINNDEQELGTIKFISNGNYEKYERIYLKFDYIITNIGALINLNNIIMGFITCFFTKKIYLHELVDNIMFNDYIKKNNYNIHKKEYKKNLINSQNKIKENSKHYIKLFHDSKIKNTITNNQKFDIYQLEYNSYNQNKIKNIKGNKKNNLYYKFFYENNLLNIKFKWYNFFCPNFLIKSNKNIIILNKCKEEIDKSISIENIFSKIGSNKEEFLFFLFQNIYKCNI